MREKILPMLFGVEIGIGGLLVIFGVHSGSWQVVALGGSVALVHALEWFLFATK